MRSSTTPRRRLLAGDADQAGLRSDAGRGDAGPRAVAQWFGDSVTLDRVAGHLAARGLRHLVGVDLERAPRPEVGAQLFTTLYNTPAKDTAFWTPPPGRPGQRCVPVQRDDLQPRRDDAAGAAGEDRRRRLLRDHARLGRRTPLRQRHHAAVHRPGRAGQRHAPGRTSSTSGSTSPRSPRPGRTGMPGRPRCRPGIPAGAIAWSGRRPLLALDADRLEDAAGRADLVFDTIGAEVLARPAGRPPSARRNVACREYHSAATVGNDGSTVSSLLLGSILPRQRPA